MRSLPPSLWLLIAAQLDARARAQADLQPRPDLLPTAIRKMPPDQGAKFHHSYCAFPDDDIFAPVPVKPFVVIAARHAHEEDDYLRLAANSSAELSLRPPFALVSGREEQDDTPAAADSDSAWVLFRRAASALAFLEKRQWACPSGTTSCSSIGFPNSCCQEGETCVEVADTGLGPVGCCPRGATCGGGVSGCGDGSTACASEIGGGCCIPGFICAGIGCIRPAPSQPPSSSPPPSSTSTPTTITRSSTPQPTTGTETQTSTAGAGAPFRPTSSSADDPPPPTSTFCPTGFYPCLAHAGGGCCQTGRDCQTTSCPAPTEMTTVVDGNGVTVVVPVGDGVPSSTGAGSCAEGWFLCGTEAGPVAGCCPTGYRCGTASCSIAGTATVAKELPSNSGSRLRGGNGWVGLMVGFGGGCRCYWFWLDMTKRGREEGGRGE
ncbi:hypothetical protein MMYC01_202960 [Madurella mycetomatis]|uniref:Uncharacterized protein n=1 Tax=Madurella mycetomatis TaxID=100816 RepID=A0A175WE54_9PEZI|nr:hypothetical protein MMYC01_202960 [Madurella mycetomatis]